MYNCEQDGLLVVFSPVTDRKFILDTQNKIVHISTCPSLKTRHEKSPKDIVHSNYRKCPLCLG
ncbi:hypothetical protein KKG56_05485 [bacterium]|nr:hypothetical protein [bacterium]